MCDTPPGPSSCIVVRSLSDTLGWFQHVVEQLAAVEGLEESAICSKLHAAVHKLRLSTAFSGIGAAEVALSTVAHGLQEIVQSDCVPKTLFGVEWYGESQNELRCLPEPPEHLFGDMCNFISPKIASQLESTLDRMEYNDLVKLCKHPFFCREPAHCLLHGKLCKAECADIHVAGTPCVDFSNIGSRKGATGKSMLPFLTWASQRRLLQESLILHENVSLFPCELLQHLLGDLYIADTAVISACDLGHVCERDRRYTWLLHKKYVTVSPSRSWPCDVAIFKRHSELTWKAFLVSSEVEREWEVKELTASRVRKSDNEALAALEDQDVGWEGRDLAIAKSF